MKLMNMKLLVLGVASMMTATPVFAVSSASASLDNLSVSLFSWMPTVTPAIIWDSSNYNYVSVSAYDTANANYQSSSLSGAGPLNAAVSTAISQASASISDGIWNSPSTNWSASGSTSGTSGGVGYQYGYFQAYSNSQIGSFTLSADTIAIFSATGSTNAATTIGYDPVTGGYEYAQAYAQLGTSGSTANGYQQSSESLSSSAYYTPTTDNKTAPLSVFFANTTSGSETGNLSAYAYAYGYSTIAAVPEPSTWAMMLGGLGLIGFMTYRRRQYF
jgi:PEP-CTERM motif